LVELNFFDWQARGMEILQNRELTLNQRLAMLLQELAKADEHLPWGRDASDVVWEPWPVAKQADFFCRFVRGIEDDTAKTAAYLELVEKVKVQGFWEQAAAQNLLWEKCEGPYGLMLENYLVNEWFKELYPCAVLGTYAYNGLYFVVQWEIWQFLLLLELTAAEKAIDVPRLIRETAGWLASRLNHYTTAQNVLMELLRDK
jgi:lysine-N-methylase